MIKTLVMNRKLHVNEQLLIDILYTSDKRAFSFLHDTFSPALHGSLLDLVETDKESAGQMLDDAFSFAGRILQAYDQKKQRLLLWILHMARRITFTALQQFNTWPQAEELERISIGLRQKLLTMNRGQRCVIELMYYKGYTKARVADTLHISVEMVNKLLQSGLDQLRLCLPSSSKINSDGNSDSTL
jgi:RNA polymerase sigma-70 factor (ECF subfamily)